MSAAGIAVPDLLGSNPDSGEECQCLVPHPGQDLQQNKLHRFINFWYKKKTIININKNARKAS
jgi:hypothetical protein